MRRLICEDCKKIYDFDVDDFCPRCGAFNQPNKKWGVDAQGNVVRVDGVNEANHKESFVHREVHSEKARRRVTGMDRDAAAPPQPAVRPAKTLGKPAEKKSGASVLGTILWIVVVVNILRACIGVL